MSDSLQVHQTLNFKKAAKKLHPSQKKELDKAVRSLMGDPFLGAPKTGDLAGVSVYKFRMNQQLTLLAYSYDAHISRLTLLALGAHENFYKELKK